MSSPIHSRVVGTFTTASTLAAVNINVPSGFDKIEIINLTDFGQSTSNIIKATGYSLLSAGSAFYSTATSSTALAVEAMTLTGGFTFLSDSGAATQGNPVAVTAITAASPAVVSTGTTPLVGNIVRITNPLGMLQIGGWDFSVTVVNPATTFTLGYLPAVGFAAAATGGSWELISSDARFYPVNRLITNITQAASAVITMSVTHGFTVGQLVRIMVPSGWGMTQINGMLGTVTAINTTTNTITVNINTTSFTAFAFPTSAVAALGTGAPQVIPVGETAQYPWQNLLDDATDNQSFVGVTIGTTILVASKNYMWIATKGTTETLPVLT